MECHAFLCPKVLDDDADDDEDCDYKDDDNDGEDEKDNDGAADTTDTLYFN